MTGALLARGLLVGLVAGLLAFCFAKVVGEPNVDRAIAFESHMDELKREAAIAAHQPVEPEEPELVSREIQSTIGLFTGIVVYAVSFGGLFALVFAFAQGRVGGLGPRGLAALLALAGFIAISLVPVLKYPANPPSVGNPDTIGFRTGMFFLMILISIAATTLAIQLGRALIARYGLWNGTLIAGLAFVVVIAVVQTLLPDINEVPEGFPAVVLWRFRLASLGIQVILWTVLGLGFGWLAERLMSQSSDFPDRRGATARSASHDPRLKIRLR